MGPVSKEIIINKESLVKDIQKAFNFYYPFLKIEFSKKEKHSLSFKNHKLSPAHYINETAGVMAPVNINVEDNRTVAEIERDFSIVLGLSAKVFRKSGNVWNVISVTDSWTLESQNKAGEFICIEMASAF